MLFFFTEDIGDGLRRRSCGVLVIADCSVEEHDVATFMSQLDASHILSLDDPDYDGVRYDQEQESEEDDDPEVDEVDDPMETQSSTKRSRTMNYGQEEDIALCFAWMNVSLDASVGTDQTKEKF